MTKCFKIIVRKRTVLINKASIAAINKNIPDAASSLKLFEGLLYN